MYRMFVLGLMALSLLFSAPSYALPHGGSDNFLLQIAVESESDTCYVDGVRQPVSQCAFQGTEEERIESVREELGDDGNSPDDEDDGDY